MLSDQIKSQMFQAMKDKHEVTKEILRLALGEIQTAEARSGRPPTDEEATAIVRKLIKSNNETMEATTDDAASQRLAEEIAVLEALLPKTLDVDQIVDALADVAEAIAAAGNGGQATGVAMKHLKGAGAAVTGKEVSAAVAKMRS
jgi:uncharacterized protein YqeY